MTPPLTLEERVAALEVRAGALEQQTLDLDARLVLAENKIILARNRLNALEDKADLLVERLKKLARIVRASKKDTLSLPHLMEENVAADPDELLPIVGGTIRIGDIPLVDGAPTAAWLLEFCLCSAHVKMRRDAVRRSQ